MTVSELMFHAERYEYNTNKAGEDVVVYVEPKKYASAPCDAVCAFCGRDITEGIPLKNVISGNFTDFQALKTSDFTCPECAQACSFFNYNFIADRNGLRLLNNQDLAREIQKEQQTPFVCVISTSKKKHLFYDAVVNNSSDNFICRFELENIPVNLEQMRRDFLFIGSLQALGEYKQSIEDGSLWIETIRKLGVEVLDFLNTCLKRRSFFVPLFLSQKPDIDEETAIHNIRELLL